MNCPKCNSDMKEGIIIIDAPQSILGIMSKNAGGLIWINEKLENYSKWKIVKDRKKLIPIGLKKKDLKQGFICENCKITVIEYG